jgi:hypothetical protein
VTIVAALDALPATAAGKFVCEPGKIGSSQKRTQNYFFAL